MSSTSWVPVTPALDKLTGTAVEVAVTAVLVGTAVEVAVTAVLVGTAVEVAVTAALDALIGLVVVVAEGSVGAGGVTLTSG